MSTAKANRNIKLFYWFYFFDAVNFFAPVLTLFCMHRGLTYPDILVLLLVWVITTFLMEVPTGAFADRFGLKSAFIFGYLLKLGGAVLYLLAYNKIMFALGAACYATSDTFFSGSSQAFIFETLKGVGRENEMSETMGRILSARFIPPVIAVLIGAYISRDLLEHQFVTIILMTLCFNVLGFIFLVLLEVPESYRANREHSSLLHVKRGLKNIFSNRDLMLLFTNECLVMIPTYIFIAEESLTQPYLVNAGLPVYMLGVVYSVLSIFTAFSLNCIKFLERHMSQKLIVLLTGITILTGFLIGIFLAGSLFAVIFVFYTIYVSIVIRYSVFSEIKNMYIPTESRATTLSLLAMVNCMFDVVLISCFTYFSSMGYAILFAVCAFFVFAGLWFPVRLKGYESQQT
jgi:MFS family permease